MQSASEAEMRERIMLTHLADRSSSLYQGVVALLRDSAAQERSVERAKGTVELPFRVSEADEIALGKQFSVPVRSNGGASRMPLPSRVAAMVFCVDAMLQEYAGGPGKEIVMIDFDIVAAAIRGLDCRKVERSGSTARLCVGYASEDEVLESMARSGARSLNMRTASMLQEVKAGVGPRFSRKVLTQGRCDAIVVNHFKTPVGPRQLAQLSWMREAPVFGAFPFQPEMLVRDSGPLQCFPGRYYIDRKADMITLVPETEASMAVSHPWSLLQSLATHNAIGVAGREHTLERFMAVSGVMFYVMKHVDADFEVPEVIRSYYFRPEEAAVTVLHFPKVRLSASGVPVGWKRASVRILTSRFEKVLTRVVGVVSPVVKVNDVYSALMDYNNLVVNTLDTTVTAERMAVSDQQDAALAIALYVNFRRHAMHKSLAALLSAVKTRHALSEVGALRLAFMAMSAWTVACFSGLKVDDVGEITDLTANRVLDWCGNDFSVQVVDADPWVVVEQEVGRGQATEREWENPCFPSADVYSVKQEHTVVTGSVRPVVRTTPGLAVVGKSKPVAACTTVETVVERVPYVPADLTSVKQKLKGKMLLEEGAVCNLPVVQELLKVEAPMGEGIGPVPIEDVDVESALRHSLDIAMGGLPGRDIVATGYRLAETDIIKETRGNVRINDAKREIPKGRYVRRPIIDAGVEGVRVASTASLLGAIFKRNVGIPNNRGLVDLDEMPGVVVDKVIATCFREGWEEILAQHLDAGMWEPEEHDIDDFLKGLDEKKAEKMLSEFFLEGEVSFDDWLLMAKGKVKSSREEGAFDKIDHAQTIMYLENSSTNGMYSAITRRFKKCLDACLRPEISLNAQESDEEHEAWYNSLEPVRRKHLQTYCYASDIRCYDRSQEHSGKLAEMHFYRRMGLSQARYDLWCQTHGPKRARNMAFGVVFTMVWGGVSGIFKTLLRNGLLNLMAVVVAADLAYQDVVTLDIKGDDMDAEFSRPIDTARTDAVLGNMFNLSAKFNTAKVRYMCKQFRIKVCGRWYFVRDPWAAAQSLLTPIPLGGTEDVLGERYKSFVADMRWYDNGVLVEEVAFAAQVFYGLLGCFQPMAKALAVVRAERPRIFMLFGAPELVS